MITIISGNHPRHKFFVNKIAEIAEIENQIIEKRENFQCFKNNKKISIPFKK